jgi:2-octaprenyl-6-methoxyphenol hydroxylase
MESGTNATGLMSLSEKDFERAMTERSCSILGPLQLVTRRSVWPIIAQLAKRLSGQRVALIAEAAHVVPPIGAQGLNMSLTDIKTLRDLAVAAPDSLGSTDMLDRYHTARYRDLQIRVQGITLLNKTSMVDLQSLRDFRAAGLTALYALPQVRKTLMQMGLGAV